MPLSALTISLVTCRPIAAKVFLMVTHPRLGAASPANCLNLHLVAKICGHVQNGGGGTRDSTLDAA